ncbi:hypothetical protein D0469_02445 [Peribacillus saganii]|uniref:Uncharacterized protein n=1 Tax=Peribacillus saganii TaxID=2303992 RepID=A0A372LST9_9BACI|nr:hypothetical protein D0469_02445 [Peribacillus saganii]
MWESRDKCEKPIISCTVLITTPNTVLDEIHDRMPVILEPRD